MLFNGGLLEMTKPDGKPAQIMQDRGHASQEPHSDTAGSRMNWLRAAVLGANNGAVIPLIAILAPPAAVRVPVAFVSVLIALAMTGALSAKVGGANVPRAAARVGSGALAMTITFLVAKLFGVSGV